MTKFKKDQPFLTEDFSPEGGGIDFLGLRQVNLHILENYLLPGINNQTNDPGTYCIGTWIPWKFRKICESSPENYNDENFKKFKEKVEVIMSYSMEKETKGSLKFGMANNRIGVTQKLKFPQELEYAKSKRTDATSIYAAPLYGPSLKYLGFLHSSNALDAEGKQTRVLVAQEDDEIEKLCSGLDQLIQNHQLSSKLYSLSDEVFQESEVDQLGEVGIHPGFFRTMPSNYKEIFQGRLLAEDEGTEGYIRNQSYKILKTILTSNPDITSDQIRDIFLVRTNLDGSKIELDGDLKNHLDLWFIFGLRQYQRYCLELFRQAFEEKVTDGSNRIDLITDEILKDEFFNGVHSFEELMLRETGGQNLEEVIRSWSGEIKPGDEKFIGEIRKGKDVSYIKGVKILLRWWLRLNNYLIENENDEVLALGSIDRVSQSFLNKWIKDRLNISLKEFISDLLSTFVFSQHLRVSLSRFDGKVQRMRFVLDDHGIVPSSSVGKKIADNLIPWMADRLECFLILLKEIDVLELDQEKWKLK